MGPRPGALLPQFEPFQSAPPQGFDRDVLPRWQAIRTGGTRFVFLDNAGVPGPILAVRPQDANIAAIRELPSHPPIPRREFEITGRMSGTTFIQVFAPNGITVIQQLQVVVKNEARLALGMHRVIDGLFETTARDASIGIDLIAQLDAIFGQANVQFDMPSTIGTLSLKTTLLELVMEQREKRRPQRGWTELAAAADGRAHLNVFFMKWYGTPSGLPSQIIEKDGDTNVIFEDGLAAEKVLIALAHRIGLFSGCSATSSDRHTHHLMHTSRAGGGSSGPAGVHFIPRDCNNMLNFSGVAGPGT